ncbi:MAG: glycogen synthase GlgA [candidate division Zixibacteria bacterium]|nr:glycogen synthase GlgA [candidate division Zixibacteria bacterium]NIR65749.1 glycogen synthase GlgA [candidate division Zixibacteria bacterium]NIS16187.1 glycogen synthase GlgA [candidate division Zixibacteria bacterium]NIS47917.1 glycogen synthase GlgA [candidate division Zixibacteria bacterium]NIT52577.1 glycogen synthase GlgA [candidate division Zixibacteria bacterium]
MNILFASPEVVPFVKTGGLADVAGALPQALTALGHRVKVILPLYKCIDHKKFRIKRISVFAGNQSITIGDKKYDFDVFTASDKNSDVEFVFVANDKLFGRDGVYLDPVTGEDYPDNDERFIFFAAAALDAARGIDFRPDIIHANDWQSGMIPGYIATIYSDDPYFKNSRTVFTIHNIGYQGHFSKKTFDKLGLAGTYYSPGSPFEYWDHVNFLKIGITTSDLTTTVSETYAREIQSGNEMGFGMEGILFYRRNDLFGVLNGVDYDVWSPQNDELIPFNYSVKDTSGKELNKKALLDEAGLRSNGKRIPLIGAISRLADQKGFDLIEKIANRLFSLDIAFVLLGTGNDNYHILFKEMEKIYPERVRAFLKFDNRLAHLIEAGADMFLMPSRYEPCGLNQMYSLKYGTVPIVRKTGGLADTIKDFSMYPLEGNGFVFEEYEAERLLDAIQRAILIYKDRATWEKIMKRGMTADLSWDSSAKKYIRIYEKALEKEKVTL